LKAAASKPELFRVGVLKFAFSEEKIFREHIRALVEDAIVNLALRVVR
jgi:hypothetical protein